MAARITIEGEVRVTIDGHTRTITGEQSVKILHTVTLELQAVLPSASTRNSEGTTEDDDIKTFFRNVLTDDE